MTLTDQQREVLKRIDAACFTNLIPAWREAVGNELHEAGLAELQIDNQVRFFRITAAGRAALGE